MYSLEDERDYGVNYDDVKMELHYEVINLLTFIAISETHEPQLSFKDIIVHFSNRTKSIRTAGVIKQKLKWWEFWKKF